MAETEIENPHYAIYKRKMKKDKKTKTLVEAQDLKFATSLISFGEFLKTHKSKWTYKNNQVPVVRWDHYRVQDVPDAGDDIVMTFEFNKNGTVADAYYELGVKSTYSNRTASDESEVVEIDPSALSRINKYNYKGGVFCLDDLSNEQMIGSNIQDGDVYFVMYSDFKGKKSLKKWYIFNGTTGKWVQLASLKNDFASVIRVILTKEDFKEDEDPDGDDDDYYDDEDDDDDSVYNIALERAKKIRAELFSKEFYFDLETLGG